MIIGGKQYLDYEAAGAMTGVSRSILQRLVAGGMVGSARRDANACWPPTT